VTKLSQTKTTRNCRSQAISGSECVDIWNLEIEAIQFSAPVVPTFHNIRYSKPGGSNMKLHALTTLNMTGVGRYMRKITNFNIKTHFTKGIM